jgi:hypothetical protein
MTAPVRFTIDEANHAHVAWGANCGPGAIAAVLHLTLDELRPHLRDFERKGYTNPSLMYAVLRDLGVRYAVAMGARDTWPSYGLARIQWEGPWMAPGVPVAARYRHTHWIGCRGEEVFDINAMTVGGWISLRVWRDDLVPWLLRQVAPKANGGWHITHSIEIAPAVAELCRERICAERTS